MVPYLLLATILLPLLVAALVLVVPNRQFRNVCMFFVSAILMVATAAIIKIGPTFAVVHGPYEKLLEYGLFGIDILIGLIALVIGFRFRSLLLIVFSIAQIIPLCMFHYQIGFIGIEKAFYIDHLSIMMLLLINIIGPLIAIFAVRYMEEHEHHLHLGQSRQPQFFATILLFLGAMNGMVMVNDITWLHVFWEITTFCSFLLIGHDQTEIAMKNALNALIINFFGGVAFVFGIIFIYNRVHTLAINEILAYGDTGLLLLPLAFIIIAGFTKSAQIPFQSWLLGAMVAPTPVSALLHSSTMVKAGIYLIFRFAPLFIGTWLANISALVGAFTFAAAALLAISQSNAKRVLAYSTISNLGLMITLICILDIYAVYAAALLIVLHGLSKSLLFLCVGTIEQAIGSRDLEDMDGIRQRLPLTASLATFGAITMLLPPFGVLITKWVSIEVSTTNPPVMLLVILGSAFTVLFWAKFIGKMLSSNPSASKIEKFMPVMHTPLIIISGLVLTLSFFLVEFSNHIVAPFILSAYLGSAQPTPNILLASFAGFYPPIFFGLAAVTLLIAYLVYLRFKPNRLVAPFMSSENAGENKFYSLSDGVYQTEFRSYYFANILNEQKITTIINAIAAGLLIVLVGVIFK